jgi:hypothetical protein
MPFFNPLETRPRDPPAIWCLRPALATGPQPPVSLPGKMLEAPLMRLPESRFNIF